MNKEIILSTFLQSNSLSILIEVVSTQIHCPIILTDNSFHIVTAFNGSSAVSQEYRRAITHSQMPQEVCQSVANSFADAQKQRVTILPNNSCCTVAPVNFLTVPLGYIFYIGEVHENDCIFAESVIAKQFYFERNFTSVLSDSAEEILIELLQGKFETKALFDSRISGTFLSHFSPERFAVIEEGKPSELCKKLAVQFNASFPFVFENKIILFLHRDHDLDVLKDTCRRLKLRCVISQQLSDLYSLKSAYFAAADVLMLDCFKNSESFCVMASDYAFAALLGKLEFCYLNEDIRRIFEYDKKNNTEFCLTLYTYLCCRHSLLETSKRLFTHKNTVQYRIRKIKDDFSIDADSPEHFAEYFISLAIALYNLGNKDIFINAHTNEYSQAAL